MLPTQSSSSLGATEVVPPVDLDFLSDACSQLLWLANYLVSLPKTPFLDDHTCQFWSLGCFLRYHLTLEALVSGKPVFPKIPKEKHNQGTYTR